MELVKCKCTAFWVLCTRFATQEDFLCDSCRENTCCVLEMPEQSPVHAQIVKLDHQGKEGQ